MAAVNGDAAVRVSIVIDNFNYARYLAQAIDSALGQTWGDKEVIVVDDGSTDGSAEVIRGYGDRVRSVFQPNGGQAAAINAGFAQSRGEVVIFLDADDVLLPMAAERAAAVFAAQPATAKVQYRMAVVDAHGRKSGAIRPTPRIPLQSGDLRRQEVSFPFDLPWAAMSANAFSAAVLRRILPISVERYRREGTDWYLAHASALFGDVCALDEVCALYRIHGANQYGQDAATIDLGQIGQAVRCAAAARQDLERFADDLRVPRPDPILSVSDVASRLTLLKLARPEPVMAGETVPGLVGLGLRAAARRFDIWWPMKLMFMAWFLAMGLSPRPVAKALATGFFVPERRATLNTWLGRLHRGAVS
jgi:hypothetical protein